MSTDPSIVEWSDVQWKRDETDAYAVVLLQVRSRTLPSRWVLSPMGAFSDDTYQLHVVIVGPAQNEVPVSILAFNLWLSVLGYGVEITPHY